MPIIKIKWYTRCWVSNLSDTVPLVLTIILMSGLARSVAMSRLGDWETSPDKPLSSYQGATQVNFLVFCLLHNSCQRGSVWPLQQRWQPGLSWLDLTWLSNHAYNSVIIFLQWPCSAFCWAASQPRHATPRRGKNSSRTKNLSLHFRLKLVRNSRPWAWHLSL